VRSFSPFLTFLALKLWDFAYYSWTEQWNRYETRVTSSPSSSM